MRVVQEDFKSLQRLVCLEILAKPMKGVELTQRRMFDTVQLPIRHVLAAMRYGASLNGAAIRQLLFFHPNILDVDVACFSPIDVGSHFDLIILDLFFQSWVSLLAHIFNEALLWRERAGEFMKSHSNTCWWSKWEVLKQVSYYFGDVFTFLEENVYFCPATLQNRLDIFENTQDLQDARYFGCWYSFC